MYRCEICGWEARERVFVRPAAGGPRVAHFFCDDDCIKKGLSVLSAAGLVEDSVVRGYDVFRPMFD